MILAIEVNLDQLTKVAKQIKIADAELAGFTAQAVADLESAVIQYKNDLLSEISRIEASHSVGNAGPEVTSAMVHDAELVYSRGPRYRRRKRGVSLLKAFAGASIFVSGMMADSDFLKSYTHIVMFMVTACAAMISSTIIALRE